MIEHLLLASRHSVIPWCGSVSSLAPLPAISSGRFPVSARALVWRCSSPSPTVGPVVSIVGLVALYAAAEYGGAITAS